MALTNNFNFNPYYDDYDENKKFLRILFKPGYAVQARELTQLQTQIQKQIERFGNSIFVNGSAVLGCYYTKQICGFLKLETTISGVSINISNFDDKIITNQSRTKRAKVIVAVAEDLALGEPPTLLIQQVFGDPFLPGERIETAGLNPFYATIRGETTAVGEGQAFSISEGVIYYNGFFVKVDQQSIAISKYDITSASLKVGLEINEYFVKASDDSSLIDPAQEATNYQAPGADRYKVELTLATRNLDDADDLVNFIQLAQFVSGQYQNTKKTTIYSKLGDEMAKRTFEESGNYVLDPFTVIAKANTSDTSKFDLIVGRGTAYVKGYRIDVKYPEKITLNKARTTANVNDRIIRANYGNYFYTTKHFKSFDINNLPTVDLHCVPAALIDTTSVQTIQNTKIGTAVIKSTEFVVSQNTDSSACTDNFIFATEVYNVNVGSLNGRVVSATSDGTKIVLPSTFSQVNDAYTGAFFRITGNAPGSSEVDKIIADYDGASKTITVSPPFATIPTTVSNFEINFNTQDIESLASFTSTTRNASADISTRLGIEPATEGVTNRAILFDSLKEELIFNVGQTKVARGTFRVGSYFYQARFTSGPMTSGVATFQTNNTDRFAIVSNIPLSTEEIRNNYILYCENPGTSAFTNGQIIPTNLITIQGHGTGSLNVSVTGGQNMSLSLIATVEVQGVAQRTKTFIQANTANVDTGATEVQIDGTRIKLISSMGQVHYANTAGTRIAERNLSLYVADVVRLAKVVEIPSGVINQTNFTNGIDVTSRYRLVNNQTDSEYLHSYIRLKAGQTAPIGALVICFDRYQHSSSTGGAFTVDSYPEDKYDEIGVYFSTNGAQGYDLRDCLDFRPSRTDGASGSIEGNFGSIAAIGPRLPKRQAEFRISFDHYLPRTDRLHLAHNGLYDVSSGTPSLDRKVPTEKDNSISICDIEIPAYTEDVKDIKFKHYNNRRYTMADIGKIESRLKAIEYYTALSLLENDALSKSDSSMYGRSKNGIITDSFVGFNVADLINGEFNAAINRQTKELTTKTRTTEGYFRLVPPENGDSISLVNARRDGSLIYLSGNDSVIFVDQPFATTAMSVNPFNVQFFVGALKMNPKSDIWIDTLTLPDLIIEDEGNENMLDFINEVSSWAEWEWSSWERVGNLVEVRGPTRSQTLSGRRWWRTDQVTTVTTFENQSRDGTLTYYVPETVLTSLGEFVVDTSVIPFMREIKIDFTIQGMRPFEVAYPFFDDTSISKYVSIDNIFTMNTGSLGYYANNAMPENVLIKNGGTVIGNAEAILISNTQLYVANVTLPNPVASWSSGIFVQGNTSGYNAQVVSYNLNSCFVNTTISTPTTTTFSLSTDAFGAGLTFTSNETPIRIVNGKGAGQESIIVSYTTATRSVVVSPAFTEAPGANSIVQIGNMKMDRHGCVSGTFHVPSGVFPNGAKTFKLSNQVDGSIQYPFSRAVETFYSQGTLQTKQERILSTITPREVVDTATQARTLQVAQREDRVQGTTVWVDPVAETFLVDGVAYPDGIFLSKVRLCFQSKDDQLPVRIQIRPSVNGYPSATQSVPFSDVSKMPDQVNVTDRPDFENSAKYTEFVFDSPIYLLPGEHALVVLSNSNNYFIWTAIKDEKDVNTGNAVGQQPYAGSFFKSQNSSTWTADQDTDLMFRLYKYEWDTTKQAEAIFTLDWANPARTLTSNANVDVMVLKTQDINFPNTFLQHSFTSRTKTGQNTGYVQIIPNMTTLMLDTFGSRVIRPSSISDFKVKATMRTRNPHISPVLDVDRYFIFPVENVINNLGISNNNVFMSNVGNYTSGTTNPPDAGSPTVTFSAPPAGGVTATGTANLVSATVGGVANRKIIDKIIITNPGSGYTSTPTVTITGGTTTSGYAATAYVTGETDRRNGNSLCRYVTKKITLADGFNSGDLRVYLTAHKPAGSNILVYYKILAAGDAQQWTDRTWQLMTQIEQPAYVSPSFEDFNELVFAPGTNNRASDAIEYTSATSGKFYDFNSFAIKIVMTGTNTVDVPRIKDFRAIAMPAI